MRYLYRCKEGGNWYVRLQPPGQKLVERSLGTSDQKAAENAAADLIKQHKAFMYQRRQGRVASVVHGPWAHEYAPGLHKLQDGRDVMATESYLTFSDGTRRPNGGPAIYLTGARLSATREFQAFDDAYASCADFRSRPAPVFSAKAGKKAKQGHIRRETASGRRAKIFIYRDVRSLK